MARAPSPCRRAAFAAAKRAAALPGSIVAGGAGAADSADGTGAPTGDGTTSGSLPVPNAGEATPTLAGRGAGSAASGAATGAFDAVVGDRRRDQMLAPATPATITAA